MVLSRLKLSIKFLISRAVVPIANDCYIHGSIVEAVNDPELAHIFPEVGVVSHRNGIIGSRVVTQARNGLEYLQELFAVTLLEEAHRVIRQVRLQHCPSASL